MTSVSPSLAVRVVAAVLVLAGGALHLKIWNGDYRDLPSQVPGVNVVKVGFPVNAALSVALVIALFVLADQIIVTVMALAAELVFIVTLILSRTTGILGWKEKGDWGSSPIQVLVVEILSVVALAALAALQWWSPRERVSA